MKKKEVQAVFFDVWGPMILWNLLEAAGDHPAGSTVSSSTLEMLGLVPPLSELERAMADPRVQALMVDCNDWCDEDDDLLDTPPDITCEISYDPTIKPIAPHYPLDISKQVPGYAGATNLHCQMWVREWFQERKGRPPEDDFVAWAVNILETGGSILLVHKPKSK